VPVSCAGGLLEDSWRTLGAVSAADVSIATSVSQHPMVTCLRRVVCSLLSFHVNIVLCLMRRLACHLDIVYINRLLLYNAE